MLLDSLLLALGVAFAGAGGELFVRGLVSLAEWVRVPARVIGVSVAAFATSSPELTVAVNAASEGRPDIALGDALGSNIVNVAVVAGVVLAMGGVAARDLSGRDAAVALAAAGLVFMLLLDGGLSRRDGFVLLLVFVGWIVSTIDKALATREESEAVDAPSAMLPVAYSLVGLAILIIAGRLLVTGATGVGKDLGISTFVVGVVLVSIGTSLPELATGVISKLRGHEDLGLGAVLGSNIFNMTFIVAIAALISPIDVDRGDALVTLVVGAALLLVLIWRAGSAAMLSRWRGASLLAGYAGALTLLVVMQ